MARHGLAALRGSRAAPRAGPLTLSLPPDAHIETHLVGGVRGKGALPPETQAARSAHPGGSAALHFERYLMVRVCRRRQLLQPQYAVTGGMFHVIISLGLLISVGVGLWGSRGLGLSPARGGARGARGARGTRARGAGGAAALRHAHAPGGAHTDAGTRHACTSLAYVRRCHGRCTPHPPHTEKLSPAPVIRIQLNAERRLPECATARCPLARPPAGRVQTTQSQLSFPTP